MLHPVTAMWETMVCEFKCVQCVFSFEDGHLLPFSWSAQYGLCFMCRRGWKYGSPHCCPWKVSKCWLWSWNIFSKRNTNLLSVQIDLTLQGYAGQELLQDIACMNHLLYNAYGWKTIYNCYSEKDKPIKKTVQWTAFLNVFPSALQSFFPEFIMLLLITSASSAFHPSVIFTLFSNWLFVSFSTHHLTLLPSA